MCWGAKYMFRRDTELISVTIYIYIPEGPGVLRWRIYNIYMWVPDVVAQRRTPF